MQLSDHTIKAKRQEKIAKGVVWGFVILTLLILAWIVLYVLFRGFVSTNHVYYDTVDIREELVTQPGFDEAPFRIIVNRGVRIKDDLDAFELLELYTKRRQPNWGDITGQDLDVELMTLNNSFPAGEAFEEMLLNEELDFSRHVKAYSSTDKLIEAVRSTKGAIGIVPAAADLNLHGVKRVPFRRIIAFANPSVYEIVNNVQMQEITTKQLKQIYTGEVTNWKEIGGINLAIRPVIYDQYTRTYGFITESVLGEEEPSSSLITVKSPQELQEKVSTLPGAVGLTYWSDITDPEEPQLPLVSFDRFEVRRNLDIFYLIEAPARSGKWGGISTIIINTLFLIVFTLLFSTPIGVLGAIYMVEYARQGRLMRILRMGTETLAGIPSIVFGLFGFIFFVDILGLGIGFISAVLTVTMMILPTIIRTSEEALKTVPLSYREGSLAVGATKLQTIRKVVIPAATPGILTGIILAVGRTVGETAVLVYTLGSNYELVKGPSSSARVLSLHLYNLFSEAISFDRSFATGTILIFIIIIVNFSTTKLIGSINKKSGK